MQLFASPKMIALAKAGDENSCTPAGADAVILIAGWSKSFSAQAHAQTQNSTTSSQRAKPAGAAPDKAALDAQQAAYLDAMRARLAQANVANIDKTLDDLSCAARDAEAACSSRLFAAPACDGDDYGTTANDCTDTSCAFNDVPDVDVPDLIDHDRARARAAESKLASIFRELDTVRPSRAMQGEWNVLRDRYRAGLSHAARETIRHARRSGSATLGRDAHAQRRFDEAGRMVDAFVRGDVAFSADAMNLVHSAVAAKDHGRIRSAGMEAFHGRGTNRQYLPGAAVARATSEVFATVRERRANGEAAPLVAAMFDQRMISIHPYMDANGRTTRLMTDWLLAREGFPPALATGAAPSSILLWENGRIARDAHLEHITEGMRRSVELVEAVA